MFIFTIFILIIFLFQFDLIYIYFYFFIPGKIFIEWLENVFIPLVKDRKPRECEKSLLLLDNAPCHPPLEQLNSIDPQFEVKYLPPNVMSLIQPTDQGVIENMKKHYKKYFIKQMLLADAININGMKQFFKSWTLYDTVFAVSASWKDVTQNTLSKAWKKLFREEFHPNTADTVSSNVTIMLGKIDRSQSYSILDAHERMQEDADISAYYEPSDQEIIACVSETNIPSKRSKTE